jgi:uncharacterized protein (DUF305 family)
MDSIMRRSRAPRRRAVTLVAALASSALLVARLAAQGGQDFAPADVKFMQGMIYHHAQAVVMADWAESHHAGHAVALFCKKVALSQESEIRLMQNWLAERGQEIPDPLGYRSHDTTAMHMGGMSMSGGSMGGMSMGGMNMQDHMMPGMLTPDQMHQLDQARDSVFDRLFLTFMIQHHQGAITMVTELYATPGAGQQADLSAFANGVNADQSAEIRVMHGMLAAYTQE